MLKTLTAIAALAGVLAVNIAPAHAVLSGNGSGESGIHLNGGGANGLELNGGGANGGGSNGVTNIGGGSNGASEASSTLSIQAFELPAETR